MKPYLKNLKEKFKKLIISELVRTKSYHFFDRKIVYDSAIRAMEKINSNNEYLSDHIKHERIALINLAIKDIEKKFVDDDLTVYNHFNFNQFSIKKTLIFLLVFFSLGISTVFIYQFSKSRTVKDTILPYNYILDENSIKSIVTNGNGKIHKIDRPHGFLYNVNYSKDGTLEEFAIIVRNKPLINALQNKTVIILLELQKLSSSIEDLDIVVQGIGKSVRKSFIINNNDVNNLFIIVNNNSEIKINKIITRVSIKSNNSFPSEKTSLLIKNLTFDAL